MIVNFRQMREVKLMKKHEAIIFLIVLVSLFYFLFYKHDKQIKIQNTILKDGVYTIALINDEYASKGSRDFYSSFLINNTMVEVKYTDVSKEFYLSHEIGDTIIIKFLPREPKKSIIIENEEYKSCYGIPPAEGWVKLPNCTDKSFLSNEKSNNSDIENNKDFKNKPLSFSSDRELRHQKNKEKQKQKKTEIIWILLVLGICFVPIVIMTKRNND